MNEPKKAGPNTLNLFTRPVYVPPRVMHRPVIHAPGITVRRLLTGEVLT